VARSLIRAGIGAEAIHGNKSQNQRERVLAAFRMGEVRTLVATDIAARGIDVDGVSHVVNFDLPNVPETYVHRIGRTARAGAEGVAISLCDGEEVAFLRDIQKLIRMTIPVSDRRADQRQAEPRPATSAFIKSPVNTKRRDWDRSGLARNHSRHGRPNETPRRIDSVAFIRGKHRPEHDPAPRAQSRVDNSRGT
jgi:ATP-dependent RNA helicase RhlE